MDNTEIHDTRKRNLIMLTLICGGFSTLLCETLLNIAIPIFMNTFAIKASTAQWLISGFILTLGVFIPCSGFLIQTFSTRRLFFTAMTLFIFGAVFAACAVNFPMILIGRLIQAFGVSILIPLNQTTILAIYPPEKLGSANGLFILVLMLAPVIGPTVSGMILQFFSWRYLFLITIPFNLLALTLAYFCLKNVTKLTKPKLDILSLILSILGFGGTIIGLNQIGEAGFVPRAYGTLLIGLISLFIFSLRQFKLEKPMLNLKIFRYPLFALSASFIMLTMVCIFGSLIIMPIFLQKVLLLSTFTSGLILLPGGIITCLASPVAGRLYDNFGPRLLIPLGYVIIIGVFIFFTNISAQINHLALIILICLMNLAMPLITITTNTHALKHLPLKERIDGSVILNTTQQIAASLGSSIFISLMTVGSSKFLNANPNAAEALSLNSGVNYAYMLGIIPLLLGFGCSFLIQPFTLKAKKLLKAKPQKL